MPLLLIYVPGLTVYFLPAMLARSRRHPNASVIFLFNVLLGWTALGWLAALAWCFCPESRETGVQKRFVAFARRLAGAWWALAVVAGIPIGMFAGAGALYGILKFVFRVVIPWH